MNIPNLTKLRDAVLNSSLERNGERVGFNMGYWLETIPKVQDYSGHNCGTVACIGGHADLLAMQEGPRSNSGEDWLDLSPNNFDRLCHPPHYISWNTLTPADAAKVISHLITTGTVDWSIIQ